MRRLLIVFVCLMMFPALISHAEPGSFAEIPPAYPVPDAARALIEVAIGELDYQEERGGVTKYGTWYGNPTAEWCAEFLCWSVAQTEKKLGTTLLNEEFPLYGATNIGRNWYLAQGRYIARTGRAVRVEVPRGADDGRPYAVDSSGNRSNRVPGTLEILPASAIPVEVFPVDGPVDFGSSGARFGAGRAGHSHQGQDVIASCGLPVLASRRGRVVYNEYHSLAGNYVVMKNAGSNTYFAYMHLTKPSKLKVGKVYDAGRTIGRVGETGDAVGCHLHFEYWVGPWQTGGHPIDPLPYLKSVR